MEVKGICRGLFQDIIPAFAGVTGENHKNLKRESRYYG
jgi:hypothetical protein